MGGMGRRTRMPVSLGKGEARASDYRCPCHPTLRLRSLGAKKTPIDPEHLFPLLDDRCFLLPEFIALDSGYPWRGSSCEPTAFFACRAELRAVSLLHLNIFSGIPFPRACRR